MIETGEGDYKEEILELNKLAQILRKQRLAAGAIDFDRVEVKFEIDETGKPLSVYFKESKEALIIFLFIGLFARVSFVMPGSPILFCSAVS